MKDFLLAFLIFAAAWILGPVIICYEGRWLEWWFPGLWK
jgi:hypothetical protein